MSISSRPIKDTQPCQGINKTFDNEAAPAYAPLRSSIDLLSSFPSPQEFEFAKVLHNSLPASPVSPLRPGQDVKSLIDTYISKHGTVTTPVKARNVSILTKMEDFVVQCPIIKRHPLHTFLIPNLCLLCRRMRERNIARFEAEAIKDSVEMALTSGFRNGKDPQGTSSVINDERRKISPPRGKKGTIPLILAALHSQQGRESVFESRTNAEGQISEEVEAGVNNSSPSAEIVSTDAAVSIAPTPKKMQALTGGCEGPNSRDTHSRNISALSAGTAPSWWWWRKLSANTASAIPPSAAESPPPSATSRRKSSVKTDKHRRSFSTLSSPSSQSGHSRLSWIGKYDQDVQRDVLGRSAKGMNRIMGWSSEGGNDK